jgi:hypothetical protein
MEPNGPAVEVRAGPLRGRPAVFSEKQRFSVVYGLFPGTACAGLC